MYELSPIMVKFTEKHRLVKVKNKLQRFVYTLRVVTTRHIDVMLTCPALIGWALNSVWQTVTALQILYAFPDECLRNRGRSFYRFAVHLILSHFLRSFRCEAGGSQALVRMLCCDNVRHARTAVSLPQLTSLFYAFQWLASLIPLFTTHRAQSKRRLNLASFLDT